MQNSRMLEMLEAGRIEEVKEILRDEIYMEALKQTPNTKKRYTAMKKYFSYVDTSRKVLQKPCVIEFEGKTYTSFTNSWSLVLTTEYPGEIELFDKENGTYPDVGRLVRFDGVKGKINISKVIAKAKSLGYKLNKKEVGPNFTFLMLYDGTYYKVGLTDMTYKIIDDGEIALTYHPFGEKMPLTIQTSLGFCMIMPVHIKDKTDLEERHIVVEADSL